MKSTLGKYSLVLGTLFLFGSVGILKAHPASPSLSVRPVIDSMSLKSIDSVVAEPGYTVFHFADTTSLRFHFTVKTAGGSVFSSWSLRSDFVIANGFIAYNDANRTALILIGKLKAGELQPAINKDDLTQNGIPQQ